MLGELPRVKALRLPASTTDSIPHDGVTEVLYPTGVNEGVAVKYILKY